MSRYYASEFRRRFSQGWSILIAAAVAAFAYDLAISLVSSRVNTQVVELGVAIFAPLGTGFLAAAAASALSGVRSTYTALGAGVLAPFLTIATGVGGAFIGGMTPWFTTDALFFLITGVLSVAGSALVAFARPPRLLGPRRHLRRVK